MSDFAAFLGDGRHIFCICPECGETHRLTDLEISKKGKQTKDFLDKFEDSMAKLEDKRTQLEARARELQDDARRRAVRRVLPQLLRQAVPGLYRRGINPQDVRTLIHPVEFVAFEGMSSDDGVHQVTFLNMGPATQETQSLQRAIEDHSLDWATLRVSDDGSVSSRSLKVEGSTKTNKAPRRSSLGEF